MTCTLETLYYASKPFWAPLLQAISLRCPFHVHPLWDLAMWCATSSIILHGRGDLPALILLREVVCASPRCPHTLWESWSPLEWFWGYWGRSKWCHTPIHCECAIQLLLDICAEFQGNQSGQKGCVVIGIVVWVGGEVRASMLPHSRPGGPSLHCIGIPALSHSRWVHIHTCCCTCSASPSNNWSTVPPCRVRSTGVH